MTRPRDTAALTELSAGSGIEKLKQMGRQKRPPKMAPATAHKQESFSSTCRGAKNWPHIWEPKTVP